MLISDEEKKVLVIMDAKKKFVLCKNIKEYFLHCTLPIVQADPLLQQVGAAWPCLQRSPVWSDSSLKCILHNSLSLTKIHQSDKRQAASDSIQTCLLSSGGTAINLFILKGVMLA